MILENWNQNEVSKYIVSKDIEGRLTKKVMSGDQYKAALKRAKELGKLRSVKYPVVFGKPVKLECDRNEYYAILAVTHRGHVDFNLYLRVYSGTSRGYVYYTMPVRGNLDKGFCMRMSRHFIDKYEGAPEHFLVTYSRDLLSTDVQIPLGMPGNYKMWIPTRSGLILCMGETFVSRYSRLSEFTLENRQSYKDYCRDMSGAIKLPSLQEVLLGMYRGQP